MPFTANLLWRSFPLVAALMVTACAIRPVAPISATEVGELRPGLGILKGYLAQTELPDSLALLPAPPAEGSAAMALDVATFQSLGTLRQTPRGALAVQDANLHFPPAAQTFACALGVRISEQDTPHLNMLLRRTLSDAALATYAAKNAYQRTRPFVTFKTASCTPGEEVSLAKDGSYPSGHSAIGWAWALTLTEIAPERGNALLQRGRAYGQSRAICGVHWHSDVEAGRLIGAATVARLHANPVFNAQMAAAREEIAKARSQGAVPADDCAQKGAALETSSKIEP